jgi:hypothetical protein
MAGSARAEQRENSNEYDALDGDEAGDGLRIAI